MNIVQINSIRATAGLPVIVKPDNSVQKKRQAANHAKRAQENRDIRAKRGSKSK